MRSSCLLASLAFFAATVPARAEAPRRIANASLVVQRVVAELTAEGRLPVPAPQLRQNELVLELPRLLRAERLVMAAARGDAPRGRDEGEKKSAAPACELGSSCSYRALLGSLVVTRDLQIPGAPTMAVRLIPTSSALAGDTSPIVLRPRVDGAGSNWTGVDLAARF